MEIRRPNHKITPEVLERHFAGFNTFGERDLTRAKAEAISFCQAMASGDQPARWLTLLGSSGGGKSMLTKLIRRVFEWLEGFPDEYLCRRGDMILRRGGFKPWCEVVGDMRQGDFSGIPQLKQDWFLAVDDIGAEHQSPMAIGKLYEVMTAREGKFSVFNANLTLEALARLDVRLASRIERNGSVLVEIETADFNHR